MYCILCIVYRVSCIVCWVSCIAYRVLCIMYCVLCIVYRVSYIVYSVLCLVYFVLRIVYCVLCIVYCVLRIVVCTLFRGEGGEFFFVVFPSPYFMNRGGLLTLGDGELIPRKGIAKKPP